MPRGRVGRLAALFGLTVWTWGLASCPAWAQVSNGGAFSTAPGSIVSFGAPPGAACATGACGGGICQRTHCPPWFHHCQERPPVICIKCGCPRPVCNPCALPNFG